MFKAKKLEDRIERLEREIYTYQERQVSFLNKAHEIMKTVTDNDKKKFMYEIMEEDIELIEDGKKYRAIIKIIN